MQNIDFKAELRDPIAAEAQCKQLQAKYIGLLKQTDTYFKLPEGRLKRRETSGDPVEWIFYHRPDRTTPRMSNYTILTDEQAQRRWGTVSLKEWLRVRKKRRLWMLENVRIHLDEVESLGHFIEFEAQVIGSYDVKRCHDSIAVLRKAFAPTMGEPISTSYSDLVAQQPQDVER
jgi:adenylate cyclase, class 2